MEILAENTVHTGATSKTDSENEFKYMASMDMAKSLLKQGLITNEELCAFDTKMRQKYNPKIGTLWQENTLLCS